MAGYSSLMHRDEALAMELLEEHRTILRDLFGTHEGIEIETAGDAFLIEFASALKAVKCAVAAQKVLETRNQKCDPQKVIQLRIGIHVGDVVHRDGKLMGDAVNIAARIEPMADPGGICVSRSVFEQVANKLPFQLKKLESSNLKHIDTPVEVYKVLLPWAASPKSISLVSKPLKGGTKAALAAIPILVVVAWLAYWRLWPEPVTSKSTRPNAALHSPGVATTKTIAVVTFTNLSPDPADEYLGRGITEQLFDELMKLSELRVIPARSGEIREKASELKIEALLEGSVRKEAGVLRVTARVQDLADGAYIWSQTYSYAMTNILDMQSEVAQKVAQALQIRLAPGERQAATKRSTQNPEAYRLYIQGRSNWNKYTEDGFRKSIDYYNEAIRIDPDYALAYSGLADSWIQLGDGEYVAPKEAFAKAFFFVRRALELNRELGPAYVSRGTLRIFSTHEFAEAEADFKEAKRLSPNYADLYHFYGHYLEMTGRMEEAIQTFKHGLTLDPLSPVLGTELAGALYHARRYDEAEIGLRQVIKQNTAFAYARNMLAFVLIQQGRSQEALDCLAEVRKLEGGGSMLTIAQEGYVMGRLQNQELITARLSEFKAVSEKAGIKSPYFLAWIQIGMGKTSEAVESLREALEMGSIWMAFMGVDPVFLPLRDNPDFKQILKEMGLKQW